MYISCIYSIVYQPKPCAILLGFGSIKINPDITREHLKTDRASHIYKHLNNSKTCRSVCGEHSFEIIDQASTGYDLKIKEALHILWEKPSLNVQVKHFNIKLTL